MALFQKAPATLEEAAKWGPLEIPPDKVKDLTEAEWYAQVYRGDSAPQLTVRAIVMGSVLGFFLSFTNLYVGLKTGWGLGVAITACILSYAFWSIFMRLGFAKTPMTILENNCMQSTASAAGYATGGTMVSAIAALLMVTGAHQKWYVLGGWTFFLGILGTVLAIPMKRNMINRERLPFPSGLAAAVTLQSLYSEGKEAIAKAKALGWSALVGSIFPLLTSLPVKAVIGEDGKAIREPLLPENLNIFDAIPAPGKNPAGASYKWSEWLVSLENSPVMIAAGAIMGLRTTIWMMIAGAVLVTWLGPHGLSEVWTNPADKVIHAVSIPQKAWREVGLWLGAPILVSSGLATFAMQWRTIVSAFKGGSGEDATSASGVLVAQTEVPGNWMIWGALFGGTGVVALGHTFFEIPWHYGILAVFMTFFLSLVACRATGETDITPIGAMGKIMQLTYGVLIPQNATANLMTASITSSASGSAADLLNDLKAGYLLGANPRRQFMAQFLGVFTGTVATTLGFYLLVPDASALGGTTFPAPAAASWKAIADIFKNGIGFMHPYHRTEMYWGVGIGAMLVVLEASLPKARKWLPSASGVGLGLILPFFNPFSMFLGALGAFAWSKSRPAVAEKYLVPVAAGIIAGAALMGVVVAILNNTVLAQ